MGYDAIDRLDDYHHGRRDMKKETAVYDNTLAAFDYDSQISMAVTDQLLAVFDKDSKAEMSKAKELAFRAGYKYAQLKDLVTNAIKLGAEATKLAKPVEMGVIK